MYTHPVGNDSNATDTANAYASTAYEWTGHSRVLPPEARSEHGNSSWIQTAPQSSAGAYGTGPSYARYASEGGGGQSQSQYVQNTQARSQPRAADQDLGGLSNLAYASGLESTRSRAASSQAYSNTTTVQSRTSGQDVRSRRVAGSTSAIQDNDASVSDENRQLAVNAAAALADAASRGQTRNQSHGRGPTTASTSSTHSNMLVVQRTASSRADNQNSVISQWRQPDRNAAATVHQSRRVGGQTRDPTFGGETSQSSSGNNPNITHSAHRSSTLSSKAMQGAVSISDILSTPHEILTANTTAHGQHAEAVSSCIDPSQVFNPYHREHEQRRERAKLAEAKAEAKRKAEEETLQREREAAKAGAQAQQQVQRPAQLLPKSGTASKKQRKSRAKVTGQVRNDNGSTDIQEESMATEMKSIMDKMKAFRSKDPSLFQKLWSDVREEPGTAITITQVASLPSAQPVSSDTASNVPKTTRESTHGPTVQHQPQRSNDRPALPETPKNTSDMSIRLNGYKVVVEDNEEGLPDLGRFPAERRVRHKYHRKSRRNLDNISEQEEQQQPQPTASRNDNSSNLPSHIGVPIKGYTTVWPLEKRAALTDAALKSLKAIPANTHIQLTEEDLYQMLDKNPSYTELCQLLEDKGVTLNKGQFAREILNSVPDLIAQPKIYRVGARPVADISGTLAPPVQSSRVPAPLPGKFPPAGPHGPNHNPHANTLQPVNLPPPVMAAVRNKKTTASSRPEPPPGPKEAAARKRSLADLIDLTELDDDENYVTHSKFARLDDAEEDEPGEVGSFATWQKPTVYVRPEGLKSNSAFGLAHRENVKAQLLTFNAQPYAQKPVGSEAEPSSGVSTTAGRMILAKSMDKTEASKKIYYDPRTIARDVLITSGRHIWDRPLNVHLAGILGKFIEIDSDVSTFEWDEIDPGGPPTPQVPVVDVLVAKPRYKIGERTGREGRRARGPRRTDRTNFNQTRQPEEETRPGATPPALSTATPVLTDQPPTTLSDKPVLAPAAVNRLFATSAQATPATLDPTQLDSSTLKSAPHRSENGIMATLPIKRRGRPPGAKNKYVKLGEFKEMGANISAMSAVPKPSPAALDNRFKCRWKECNAVLHNLDTLRKHIGKLHRPTAAEASSDGYTCWWRHCQYLVKDEDGDLRTSKMFSQWSDWLKHIEKEHVTPLGQIWGDGPSTQHIGKP